MDDAFKGRHCRWKLTSSFRLVERTHPKHTFRFILVQIPAMEMYAKSPYLDNASLAYLFIYHIKFQKTTKNTKSKSKSEIMFTLVSQKPENKNCSVCVYIGSGSLSMESAKLNHLVSAVAQNN